MSRRNWSRCQHALVPLIVVFMVTAIVQIYRHNSSMAIYTLQTPYGSGQRSSEFSRTNIHITDMECTQQYRTSHFITMDSWPGRVGNYLFELFTLLVTAEEYCYTPVFKKDAPLHLKEIFDIEFSKSVSLQTINWPMFYEIACYYFSPAINNLDTRYNWTLTQYFESWKYFHHQKHYIKSMIRFKKTIVIDVEKFLKKNHLLNKTKVCVHVLRGDMITLSQAWLGYQAADVGYLKRSMSFFKETLKEKNVSFIYVSDDIHWCEENIKGDNIHLSPFSYSGTTASVGRDLALLTMCDHIIITGGTFGWIGAWLNTGTVVYYGWYPRPDTYIDSVMNKGDYYIPGWIEMK